MAIYRNIHMSFWDDAKVVDRFTPEDKYFYLFLLTNTKTNLAGCYEMSIKTASDSTGYNKETVERLLERLEKELDVIRYSPSTNEVLILNWHKYNWTSSDKFRRPLEAQIESIKNADFKAFLTAIFNGEDTVSIPSVYGSDTTDTVTVTVTDPVSVKRIKRNKFSEEVEGILEYFNLVSGKAFRSDDAKRRIQALLKDKYTPEDFKKVIDRKVPQWKGTEFEQYIRPSTLFSKKHFDEYLNETGNKKSRAERIKNISEEVMNW